MMRVSANVLLCGGKLVYEGVNLLSRNDLWFRLHWDIVGVVLLGVAM